MNDDRLREGVAALERVPVPVTWGDVERRLAASDESSPIADRPLTPSRGPRRRRVALTIASVAILVLALLVLWPDSPPQPVFTGPGPSTVPSSPSSTDPKQQRPATTAPATRTLRNAAVTAFTGSEYLVWAGEAGANDISQRADGFAVDTSTGAVRPIPVAPIDPRAGAAGVWTGTELIVCCGTGQAETRSAAAWNPSTHRWRILARPPASVARTFSPASVWTGKLMIVMATGSAVATYDPGADRWAEVVAPPAIGRSPQAVWTGDEVVLWDAHFGSGSLPPDDAVADRGWRWAPGRIAWRPLPDLPPGARTELGSVGWTGADIVVWGDLTNGEGLGGGARWRPGDSQWRPVSPSPQGRVAAYDGTPGSQTVVSDPEHGRVLIRGLQGDAEALGYTKTPLFAYDPTTDQWRTSELGVAGFHPTLGTAAGQLFVPDQATPVVGPVPP